MTTSPLQRRLPATDFPACRIALCERAAPAPDTPTLLFCGGFHSSMQGAKALWLDAFCERHGLGCVRFDYRGHGESDGDAHSLTLKHWLADLEQVRATLTGPVLLVGSSMGAWLALHSLAGSQRDCLGVVTLAAAPDFTDELNQHLAVHEREALARQETVWLANRYDDARWPVTSALLDSGRELSLLNSERLAGVRCPVRLLHAIDDGDVPWQKSLALLERFSHRDVRLQLLREGDHRLSDDQSLAIIGETVLALLPPAPTGA